MFGLGTLGGLVAPTGLPPPPPTALPATQDHRVVEAAPEDSLQADSSALSYNSSRAVLQLVQRSAEDFAVLVETGTPPESAAALTGSPAPAPSAGNVLDEYA